MLKLDSSTLFSTRPPSSCWTASSIAILTGFLLIPERKPLSLLGLSELDTRKRRGLYLSMPPKTVTFLLVGSPSPGVVEDFSETAVPCPTIAVPRDRSRPRLWCAAFLDPASLARGSTGTGSTAGHFFAAPSASTKHEAGFTMMTDPKGPGVSQTLLKRGPFVRSRKAILGKNWGRIASERTTRESIRF